MIDKHYNIAIISLCFLLFFSCNRPSNEYMYTSFHGDTVHFEANHEFITNIDGASTAKYYYDSVEKKEYIIQASFRNATLYFFRLNGKLEKIIHPLNIPKSAIWDFYMVNSNLFYFNNDDGMMLLCDSNKLLHTYKITTRLDDAYYCYSLQPNSELHLGKDTSFYLMMIDRTSDPSLPNWLKHRHTPPCIGRFRIKGDSIVCVDSIGYFPDDYKKVYHYEIFPTYTVVNQNLVYTFSDADSLFIQNTQTKEPRKAIPINKYLSNYKPSKFERDSLKNISYVEKYFVETPCISLLKYDPYRKLYYLGIQDGIKFISEDGAKVHDVSDGPSDLIILNENFQKVKSIHFNGGVFKRLSRTIITPGGIYLRINSKKQLSYEKFDFM